MKSPHKRELRVQSVTCNWFFAWHDW